MTSMLVIIASVTFVGMWVLTLSFSRACLYTVWIAAALWFMWALAICIL